MKRIPILMMAAWPVLVGAHPCPYDWNIDFAKPAKISGKNLADFAQKLNAAVKKETNNKIKQTIVVELKPDTFTKVPDKSPFSQEMDSLIQSYTKILAPLIKKGVREYGTAPVEIDFPGNFPIACILAATFPDDSYVEKKDGAYLTIKRDWQCRVYKMNDKFLEVAAKNKASGSVPKGVDPVAYTFARYSGMRWELNVAEKDKKPKSQSFFNDMVSILNGVVLYLADQKVVLAIETEKAHVEITKAMKGRGYLSFAK